MESMATIAGLADDVIRIAAHLKRRAKELRNFADDIDASAEAYTLVQEGLTELCDDATKIIQVVGVAQTHIPLLEN